MADDDEDMGTSFMRQHMSEAQPSREPGGFGDKSRNTAPKGTDSYYSNRYGGKAGDPEPGPAPSVTRSSKAAQSNPGTPGTDEFYAQKFGGDGISGGRKPKKSQQDKEVKY